MDEMQASRVKRAVGAGMLLFGFWLLATLALF